MFIIIRHNFLLVNLILFFNLIIKPKILIFIVYSWQILIKLWGSLLIIETVLDIWNSDQISFLRFMIDHLYLSLIMLFPTICDVLILVSGGLDHLFCKLLLVKFFHQDVLCSLNLYKLGLIWLIIKLFKLLHLLKRLISSSLSLNIHIRAGALIHRRLTWSNDILWFVLVLVRISFSGIVFFSFFFVNI